MKHHPIPKDDRIQTLFERIMFGFFVVTSVGATVLFFVLFGGVH